MEAHAVLEGDASEGRVDGAEHALALGVGG